jgi:hypothetical protein
MMSWGSERRRSSCVDLYVAKPGDVDLGANVTPEDSRLATALQRAGLALPASVRTGEIRGALMEQVIAVAARETGRAGVVSGGRPVGVNARLGPLQAFALTAAAMAMVVVVVLSVGLASLHAMPGNPLYSVKRVVEGAGLAVSAGHSKVSRQLSQAETRMREFEYAKAHGMKTWYLPLVRDAESDIDEVRREAAAFDSRSELDADKRAGNIVIEHEESVREALPSMPTKERESVEQWLDTEKHEREQLDHEGAAPAPGTFQPDTQQEGDGSQTYGPPTGLESPDKSGSAHVGDAASSEASPRDAAGGRSPDGGPHQERE